ncbi:hypothetical protein C8Q77DRAFT_334475 [Trametes polyzona]|nr:hypothetical protein C8Q77DRAFT_334475 [Trametes polyzona]
MRAWTLQELVASRRVIFLSADWAVLGEKDELADVLEEVTGIDKDVLTHHRDVMDISVARRLSWAARRVSRRPEDQAYCLMGLFNIHMPVLYGESGERAFIRLQHEILHQIRDHTLFAWGGVADVHVSSLSSSPSLWTTSLFAPSPAAFLYTHAIEPVDVEEFIMMVEDVGEKTSSGRSQIPRFTLDHNGLDCRLPIVYQESVPIAALLACRDRPHSYIAIALQPLGICNVVYGVRALVSSEAVPSPESLSSQRRLFRVSLSDLSTNNTSQLQPIVSAPSLPTVRFSSIYIATRDQPRRLSVPCP